ncbi:MAG: hypothetical protein ACTH3D_09400 [Halomonas sp.]|uniref:hypothetical protein n=1 Tax=Halomonas sp. TaxID=1486246 RepID=UPI003F8FEB15
MAALAYLKNNELYAEALRGERLRVWPRRNITPEVRVWIQQNKAQLLKELMPAGELRPWRVNIDGKAFSMLSSCKTLAEAQASAEARWPHSQVKVTR